MRVCDRANFLRKNSFDSVRDMYMHRRGNTAASWCLLHGHGPQPHKLNNRQSLGQLSSLTESNPSSNFAPLNGTLCVLVGQGWTAEVNAMHEGSHQLPHVSINASLR